MPLLDSDRQEKEKTCSKGPILESNLGHCGNWSALVLVHAQLNYWGAPTWHISKMVFVPQCIHSECFFLILLDSISVMFNIVYIRENLNKDNLKNEEKIKMESQITCDEVK